MSRIEDKLSKIFLNQVPEFLRVTETPLSTIVQGSVSQGSRVVTVSNSSGIKVGDKLTHPTLAVNRYVTHIISSKKIRIDSDSPVTITAGQLTFTRIDGTSNFVKFIEAYFKFLEQDQYPQELLQNAKKYNDSEKTIDSLLEQFFKQYGDDIPRNLRTDKRTFIKFFKDIHQTKGTEEAYKLFFRILFDETISFDYPVKYVLRPSDGKWVRKTVMRVDYTEGELPYQFQNTKITGSLSKATAIVDNVLKYATDGYEYYELLLNNVKGEFTSEDVTALKLVDKASNTHIHVSARAIPILRHIDVLDGGTGYTKDTSVTLIHSGGRNSYVKVKDVDETGKLLSFEIVDPGIYYYPNETTIITLSDPTISVSGNVTVTNNVATMNTVRPHGLRKGQQFKVKIENDSEVQVTARIILNASQVKFDVTKGNGTYSALISYLNAAVLRANVGYTSEYPGYWAGSSGKISEDIVIQGSLPDAPDANILFYQPFSYVVKSGVTVDKWKELAKHSIHPAGTEVFGEIELNATVSSNINHTGNTEIWDYLGFTADYAGNILTSDSTDFSHSNVIGLPYTVDVVYYRIGYL